MQVHYIDKKKRFSAIFMLSLHEHKQSQIIYYTIGIIYMLKVATQHEPDSNQTNRTGYYRQQTETILTQ
jgi:hypothetical protein